MNLKAKIIRHVTNASVLLPIFKEITAELLINAIKNRSYCTLGYQVTINSYKSIESYTYGNTTEEKLVG